MRKNYPTITLRRRELVREGVCAKGLSLFDEICAMRGPEKAPRMRLKDGRVVPSPTSLRVKLTPLALIWFSRETPLFLHWLRGKGLLTVDLQRANLILADLQDLNLRHADIRGACLMDVDMRRVTLEHADLRGALMGHARLDKAELSHADMRDAILDSASLCGANLEHADLRGANLEYADLRGAKLNECDLREANLWQAKRDEADPAIEGWKVVDGYLISSGWKVVDGYFCPPSLTCPQGAIP